MSSMDDFFNKYPVLSRRGLVGGAIGLAALSFGGVLGTLQVAHASNLEQPGTFLDFAVWDGATGNSVSGTFMYIDGYNAYCGDISQIAYHGAAYTWTAMSATKALRYSLIRAYIEKNYKTWSRAKRRGYFQWIIWTEEDTAYMNAYTSLSNQNADAVEVKRQAVAYYERWKDYYTAEGWDYWPVDPSHQRLVVITDPIPRRGWIKIWKKWDAESQKIVNANPGKYKLNATFEIYDGDKGTTIAKNWDYNNHKAIVAGDPQGSWSYAEDKKYSFNEWGLAYSDWMLPGDYWVKESKPCTGGAAPSGDSKSEFYAWKKVTVPAGDKFAAVTFTNRVPRGWLKIWKTWETSDSSMDRALADPATFDLKGAKFGIYTDAACKNRAINLKTGKAAELSIVKDPATFEDAKDKAYGTGSNKGKWALEYSCWLAPGNYWVREEAVCPGASNAPGMVQACVVKDSDEASASVTFKNTNGIIENPIKVHVVVHNGTYGRTLDEIDNNIENVYPWEVGSDFRTIYSETTLSDDQTVTYEVYTGTSVNKDSDGKSDARYGDENPTSAPTMAGEGRSVNVPVGVVTEDTCIHIYYTQQPLEHVNVHVVVENGLIDTAEDTGITEKVYSVAKGTDFGSVRAYPNEGFSARGGSWGPSASGNASVGDADPGIHSLAGEGETTVTVGVVNEDMCVHVVFAPKGSYKGMKVSRDLLIYGDLNANTPLGDGNLKATFGLYKNGELVLRTQADAQGYFEFNDIEPGRYIIREIQESQGYLLNSSWSRQIDVGVGYQNDYDDQDEGSACPEDMPKFDIHLVKGDSDNFGANQEQGDATLEGAEFVLYNLSINPIMYKGTYVQTLGDRIPSETDEPFVAVTSDIQALVTFEQIPYGTYWLRETKAPTGYNIPAQLQRGVKVIVHDTVDVPDLKPYQNIWYDHTGSRLNDETGKPYNTDEPPEEYYISL